MRLTDADRFWSYVTTGDHHSPAACWLWGGALDRRGYGMLLFCGTRQRPHRIALTLAGRPVPEGLVADHLCRVRHCVNPAHLEAVTVKENSRRGWRFGAPCGPERANCKNGHALVGRNVIPRGDGFGLCCRACAYESVRRYKARGRSGMQPA